MGTRRSKAITLVCLMIGCFDLRLCGQVHRFVTMEDDSDWWSYLRSGNEDKVAGVQKREFAATTLQIAGLDLNADSLAESITRLGDTTVVKRGDASTGREQVCYVSADTRARTYLIFERGEVASSFYLFSDGPTWNGSTLCTPSEKLSRGIATGSGLRLGEDPKQVIEILGQPNECRRDELLYYFESKRKTAPDALLRARKQHPELTDKQFHDDYDTYDFTALISAKFRHSQMSYLAVVTRSTD